MLPNKNTRAMSMTSFWCLYYWLWTDFTHISGVSYVDFQYVNTAWQKSMERFGPIHSPHLVIQHENPGSRGLEAHFQDSKFKQIILLFIVLPVSLKCVPNCSILLQDHPIWTNPSSFCRLKLKNIHNFSEGWYSILKAVVFHTFRCIKNFFKKMYQIFMQLFWKIVLDALISMQPKRWFYPLCFCLGLLWQYTCKCQHISFFSPCIKIYRPNSISYFCMFYVLMLAFEFLFFFSITWQCLEQLLVFPSYCQSSCVLRTILPLWMTY